MGRSRSAWLFLGLVVAGVVWPVVTGAVSCGDCCEDEPGTGSLPLTGFSLCCFHSISTLPSLSPPSLALAEVSRLALLDEKGDPPPEPRGILHVPRLSLT